MPTEPICDECERELQADGITCTLLKMEGKCLHEGSGMKTIQVMISDEWLRDYQERRIYVNEYYFIALGEPILQAINKGESEVTIE